MAAEATINAGLFYKDANGVIRNCQVSDLPADVATLQCIQNVQSIGTSVEALALSETTAPGWFMLKNLDATNYVEVYSSTVGVVVGKMLAGEPYGPVRLGSGMQTPAAKANTAACLIEVFAIDT